AHLNRDAAGHAVQPRGQALALTDRRGLPGEDQKRSLEGVFHVMLAAENFPARRHDHRTVTREDRLEGLAAPGTEVTPEKLRIIERGRGPAAKYLPQMRQGRAQCTTGHCRKFPGRIRPPCFKRARRGAHLNFSRKTEERAVSRPAIGVYSIR